MNNKDSLFTTSYVLFSREQWAALCDNSMPMITLSDCEIACLKSMHEGLSLEEVTEIYLPLSHLLNFYINANLRHQAVFEHFLSTEKRKTPYIIGISGSVAVGKSTTGRILQILLNRWPRHRRIELITTDGFLHPNTVLKERGLMKKKGFPETYDMHRFISFISDMKSGVTEVTVPVYSHLIYDIIPDTNKIIQQPDILILEGLNVLQSRIDYLRDSRRVFVSDFIDFSIYIDAPESLLERWYISRFLKFRKDSFTDPHSYFYYYTQFNEEEVVNIATHLWHEINKRNLKENILPTREYASLILSKSVNHTVEKVKLRKIKRKNY